MVNYCNFTWRWQISFLQKLNDSQYDPTTDIGQQKSLVPDQSGSKCNVHLRALASLRQPSFEGKARLVRLAQGLEEGSGRWNGAGWWAEWGRGRKGRGWSGLEAFLRPTEGMPNHLQVHNTHYEQKAAATGFQWETEVLFLCPYKAF